MAKKAEATARTEPVTLRVEGTAAIVRLQELQRIEPELQLQIVGPRNGSSPRAPRE